MPPPSPGAGSLDRNDLPDFDGFDFPELDSAVGHAHSFEVESPHWPDHAQPMPASPAMSETNSEVMFQRFLADAAEVVASQSRDTLPTPPTRELIRAMSRLRAARQHGAPESVADTARALGLDVGQLARHLTNEGNLHATPQVKQWLQTLPPDELDALLHFHHNG